MSLMAIATERHAMDAENTFNAIVRHCKIGKVRWHWLPKALRFPTMQPSPKVEWPQYPDPFTAVNDPFFRAVDPWGAAARLEP